MKLLTRLSLAAQASLAAHLYRKILNMSDQTKPTIPPTSDEPVFVLRAQDVIAPSVVRLWADMAELMGVDVEKVAKAREIALHMDHWDGEKKTPD